MIKLTGKSKLIVRHKDGRIESTEKHNLILNGGFDFVISKIITTDSSAPMKYIALGTGTNETVATMSGLQTETNRGQGAWTWSSGSANKTFKISATFAEGTVLGTITEAGVCNAATGGVFLDRVLYDNPLVGTSDSTITVEFEFGVV